MVLEILERTSHALRLDPLIYAFAVLLRLGMDIVVREDPIVQREYQDTLWWLVQEIDEDDWNQFVRRAHILLDRI